MVALTRGRISVARPQTVAVPVLRGQIAGGLLHQELCENGNLRGYEAQKTIADRG